MYEARLVKDEICFVKIRGHLETPHVDRLMLTVTMFDLYEADVTI
jgi:hypothetical protein